MKKNKNTDELDKLYPRIKCYSMTEKVNGVAPVHLSLSIVDVDTILSILKEMVEIKETAYETAQIADEESCGHIQLQISLANELHEKIYNQKKLAMRGLLL